MLKMYKAAVVFLVIIFGIGLAGSAKADLLLNSDPTFGIGSITYDTGTNLEWLHLTLTGTRSYSDMTGVDGTNEFSAGGAYAGFRYATLSEVGQLWIDAGIPESAFFYGPDSQGHNIGTYETYGTNVLSNARAFQAVFGYELTTLTGIYNGVYNTPGGWRTEGLALDPGGIVFPSLSTCLPGTGYCGGASVGIARAFLEGSNEAMLDYWQPLIGYHHWLVRDVTPVPEPSELILIISGFMGLFAGRKMFRKMQR